MIQVEASAPSNIALIKYMGKTDSNGNRPSNASLSYTLEHLRTFVVLQESNQSTDTWAPLEKLSNSASGLVELSLDAKAIEKFLNHFRRLKTAWEIEGNYLIRSANNFASDCGLASSASSFAALTRGAASLAERLTGREISNQELSRQSRIGSGSSCRSFFSPWAIWKDDAAEGLELDFQLEHAVIMLEKGKKAVSSSEAHRRVASSLLFEGRRERAETRLKALVASLKSHDWKQSFELCWNEFWDMHALFETSSPPFGYMEASTFAALERLRRVWQENGDGPLVTMDAGANVHILIRPDQTKDAERWLSEFEVLTSWGAK